MFVISLFSFFNTYISSSSYTQALIKGLERDELEYGGTGIQDAIEQSLRIKEEGKQLYFLADYIKRQSNQEWLEVCISPMSENNHDSKMHADRLNDFVEDIFDKIDYYEVAKQLTKYYKEQRKTNIKKVA
jgi:hypothetical protein